MLREVHRLTLVFNVCLVSIAVFLTACSTVTVSESPIPTAPLSKAQAKLMATVISQTFPGGIIAQGNGESMKPIMGDNTIVIIKPVPVKDLKEGMIVAYKDNESNHVIHQLIIKMNDSGVVKGWNNKIVDEGFVTEDNLVGVILGMLYYDLGTEAVSDEPAYLLRK